MNRRSFLSGLVGLAGAALVAPAMADLVGPVRRFWPLDRTMTGTVDIENRYWNERVDAAIASLGRPVNAPDPAHAWYRADDPRNRPRFLYDQSGNGRHAYKVGDSWYRVEDRLPPRRFIGAEIGKWSLP